MGRYRTIWVYRSPSPVIVNHNMKLHASLLLTFCLITTAASIFAADVEKPKPKPKPKPQSR